MGLLSFLGMGKAAGEAIAAPVEAIGNVLDKLFTSDEEREKAGIAKEQIEILKQQIAMQPSLVQTEINKIEAQHKSWFVAGWRPAIGWVLAISLGCYYIPQFTLASIMWAVACWNAGVLVAYPIATISGLTELIFAMLGLGGLRTVEKLTDKTK